MILQALNKSLGFLAAVIFYPIKSLIIDSLLIIADILGFVVGLLFVSPILAGVLTAKYSKYSGISKILHGVAIGLLVALKNIITSPIYLIFLINQVADEVVWTLCDCFRSIRFGARDGFKNGFFHVLKCTY